MKKMDRNALSKVCPGFRIFILITIFILATSIICFSIIIFNRTRTTSKSYSTPTHRLPKTIIPSHYRLYIDVSQLEAFVFNGTVEIDIQIKRISNEIILNSLDLNITNVTYVDGVSNLTLFGAVRFDIENQIAILYFNSPIKLGYGHLYLSFAGYINSHLHGFYRTKTRNYIGACTQFEPGFARKAFPCFDEPSFKANFTITIRVPGNLTALSNMETKAKYTDEYNTTIYEFDTTPIMSTYLVAYVIGYYDYVEKYDSNGVRIRVYTPIGKQEQGLFALETATKILPFFAQYFGIEYPLSKLDMIAVPDFGSGAMENWGAVTYRETYLLVDHHTSTQKTKQEVALVVAHELAHQWFGNLVTMEWWNDLWLNEDIFASWIEFLAVDYVYPEYDIWTQFVSDKLATCMIPDALHNSHPIEMPIQKPSEIDEIFDDITYEKGSSVLRLLHAYIGDDAFRRGLSNYLAQYAYQNTVTDNLWSHLSITSNKSYLSEILSTWTKQMGFPLLTVHEERSGNNRLLTIEQTRFLADGTSNDNLRWKIPISICTKTYPNESVYQLYMDGSKQQKFRLDNLSESDWIKLNLHSVGIYRVQYSESMLKALISGIYDHSLSPQDRFNVQTDVYALARARRLDYVNYLELLRSAYKHEDNLTVWKSILRQLGELSSIFEYAHLNTTKKLYQSYINDLLSPIYEKLQWDAVPGESSQSAILRSLILTHLGIYGYSKTRIEAYKRFEKFFIKNNEHYLINPNIRGAIYLTIAKTGDEHVFQQLKSLYLKADTQEERVRLLTALGRFDNQSLQHQALEIVWNASLVRKQDHLTGFIAIATHNRRGCELCWAYMQQNWNEIQNIYGQRDTHLLHFVENVPGLFASSDRIEEVKKFYKTYPNPFLERSIEKVVEQINIRRLVLEQHEISINKFLNVQFKQTV